MNNEVSATVPECTECLKQVEQAIQTSDATLLCRAAHTIKGILRLVGRTRAGAIAEQLEMIGKHGNCVGAAEQLPQFRRETNLVLDELRSFIEQD